MKIIYAFFLISGFFLLSFTAADREYYEIKIYYLDNKEQEQKVDRYLENAFLPALHRQGINRIGVFKPIDNDTAAIRRIYVLVPYKKIDQFLTLPQKLQKDQDYQNKGQEYLDAAHNGAPYRRIEKILLHAFTGWPVAQKPALRSAAGERVYELRSYESATEKLHASKVAMFNEGDEIGLFKRLGFNAVFYGEVLAGSHMPNLMYMTSFENREDRDQHWKAFRTDPSWKELSSRTQYQNNVSKSDILLLHPAGYSDL